MKRQRFASVWDAIEDNRQDAAAMKLRAEIMSALVRYIRQEKLTQAKAAALLGITQPRVSDLVRGRIDRFSLDNLVTLAAVVGLKPSISLKRAA